MKFRSKILLGASILAAVVAIFLFSQRKPLTFSVAAISSSLTPQQEWEIEAPNAEQMAFLKKILNQKFSYLARGAQSFAFISEDGKYVIKFFRMKHLLVKFKHHFRPGLVQRRAENLHSIFTAHKLAWNLLRQETGLVFLHLNKTNFLQMKLAVSDPLGRTHSIDLDQTEFVVQEKAELIFTYLKRIKQEQGIDAVHEAINKIVALIEKQDCLEIFDRDKAVAHNYGFIRDLPIHLDIGRLTHGKKRGEPQRIKERIMRWLDEES